MAKSRKVEIKEQLANYMNLLEHGDEMVLETLTRIKDVEDILEEAKINPEIDSVHYNSVLSQLNLVVKGLQEQIEIAPEQIESLQTEYNQLMEYSNKKH